MFISGNYLILRIEEGFLLWNYKLNKVFKQFKILNYIKFEYRVLDMFSSFQMDDKIFVVGYEGYFVVWDVVKGIFKVCLEVSKLKINFLDINNVRNLVIIIFKRNNVIQIWNLGVMEKIDFKFQLLMMKISLRYFDVFKIGEIVVVRGIVVNDVVVLDLINGRIKVIISEVYETMRLVILLDGVYVVLREYDGQNVIKIWSIEIGKLINLFLLSSLMVKYYICLNFRVLVKSDIEGGSNFSFWNIKIGENLYYFYFNYLNIGEVILEMIYLDDEILIFKNQKGDDVGNCDFLLVNIRLGEEFYLLVGINFVRIQFIGESGYLFLVE